MIKYTMHILVGLAIIFVVELIVLVASSGQHRERLRLRSDQRARLQNLDHVRRRQALEEDFRKERYQASGRSAYERIYNKQGQTIVELITRLSKEAFPDSCKCEVRVEEFNHFILLINTPNDVRLWNPLSIGRSVTPILPYIRPYLSNIAIFDRKHRCYMFFDAAALDEAASPGGLTDATSERIKKQGQSFSRWNSITIRCKQIGKHLFAPVSIYGKTGAVTCRMMLDTGASMSMITEEVAQKTGLENLNKTSRRRFETAAGQAEFPIVARKLTVENIGKRLDVAVGSSNLLGMDFFEGRGYVIDAEEKCVYVWEK